MAPNPEGDEYPAGQVNDPAGMLTLLATPAVGVVMVQPRLPCGPLALAVLRYTRLKMLKNSARISRDILSLTWNTRAIFADSLGVLGARKSL